MSDPAVVVSAGYPAALTDAAGRHTADTTHGIPEQHTFPQLP
ncbi:hypothetical protein ACIRFH_11980 [Streptomyces sp. NPDC093586]